MFLSARVYPTSRYPLMLMPEASSTCESVGALAAWASATVGAANAAETAVAMRSFFIERPFVGGKNTSAALYLGWNLPGCSTAGSHRTLARNALPLTCLIPTNVPGFARAALLENMKNYRSCNSGKRRKDRPKRDFFQLPHATPLGRAPGCYDGRDFSDGGPT